MTSQSRTSAFPTDRSSFPRLDVNRKDPVVSAVVNKMVADPSSSNLIGRKNRTLQAPDLALLQKVAIGTSNDISATASLMQMLPDTKLAMQILVSSILSPKDMVTTELNYYVEPGQFNSELAGPMLEVVRNYFEGTYKMGELLPKILEDTLFYTGSYPMVILPENTIDDAINSPNRVSVESIRQEIDTAKGCLKTVGILGNAKESTAGASAVKDFLGLEALATPFNRTTQRTYDPIVTSLSLKDGGTFDPFLSIHDNPNTLKMPMLQDKMVQDRLQDLLSVRKLSLEADRNAFYGRNRADARQEASLYRRRRYKYQPVVAVTPSASLKEKSVGHPLVMRLPSEAVIPVHVPSNPEEHLGYFVLLDELGNPLVRATETDYYRHMGASLSNNDVANKLIQKTSAHTNGREDPTGQQRADIEEMTRVYADLVEQELTTRLKNGVYGDNVQVARPTEVYRIMLSRALVRMRTQALYIPAEMMTYIAFDYNQYGVGESLMQKSKIIGGLRVMLSFANTMAAIKNSIGRTKLGVTLDAADDDPTSTVEFLVHEHLKLRQGAFPLGVSNPQDIINYFQNAAMELEVQGNTAYPETKVLLEDIQGGRIKPDTELEESLKKRHLMALGLSPETVDATMGAEFATTVVQNNLLHTKRVLNYQNQLVSFLTSFQQTYVLSSGWLMDELRKVIEENRSKINDEDQRAIDSGQRQAETNEQRQYDVNEERPLETHAEYGRRVNDAAGGEDDSDEGTDALIMKFVQAMRVSLPAPDTSTLTTQMAAFDEYVTALDKALEAYLDSGFLGHTEMGDLEEFVEPTVKAVRAHYLRQWLRNNNVMPELDDLTTFNDDESPALNLLEAHENHLEGIGKSLLTYLKALAAARKKLQPQVDTVKNDLGGGSGFGGDAGNNFGGSTDASGDAATGDGSTDLDFDADAVTGTGEDAGDADGASAADDSQSGDAAADEQSEPATSGSEGGEEGGETEVKDDASETDKPEGEEEEEDEEDKEDKDDKAV